MGRPVLGGPAPLFAARSKVNPRFVFGSLGGRFVLLGFVGRDPDARQQMLAKLAEHRRVLDDDRLIAFLVTTDPEVFEAAADAEGVRWFEDADGAISRAYEAESPRWVLIDPSLRLIGWGRPGDDQKLFSYLQRLPTPDAHAGVPLNAPVLIVPRVLDPAFCTRLIAHYQERGGQPSGIMVERDGRTVPVLNDFKKRFDADIVDPNLQAGLQQALVTRLLPEVRKAFQFQATRIERFIVACYDASSGGYFRPHRDDTTAGTAHRKFAVSINLNAEQFTGGDLRFPEFGSRTYRPPTGGAVVFSCSLLHEATPVTEGVRYATLPFLYDEAGHELRQRNAHLLGAPPPEAKTGEHQLEAANA